jgi:cellulose biosynthesis protein BcsQ
MIYFNDALRLAVQSLRNIQGLDDFSVRLIRDVYGRVRFAVDAERLSFPDAATQELERIQNSLGVYGTPGSVMFRDSFSFPDKVFDKSLWHLTVVHFGVDEDGVSLGSDEILVLDRQVVGQDWLNSSPSETAHPHRLVFFGLKGGVGRSTALCLAAWGLARAGLRVLLVDFDLESPGLSGLILPDAAVAPFGVVDWLLEDAVGQGESVLSQMVSASPLGSTTPGAIRVVAAMGQGETDYLSKLARAYADVSGTEGPVRVGARMRRLIETLEAIEKPDVVLIDSRAGLHDLAAVSITNIADTALLFATDNAQTWQGYKQLFSYWQMRPDVAQNVRERLAFVRALTPKSARENGVRDFQQSSYELFAGTLYDEIPAGSEDSGNEYFHPSDTDEAAPHFPILIDWDERFQEFDPTVRVENGGVTDAQIEAAFGGLLKWVLQRVSGDHE